MNHPSQLRVVHGRDEHDQFSFAVAVPEESWSDFCSFLADAGISHGGSRQVMISDDHFERWQFFPERNNIEIEQVLVAYRDDLFGRHPEESATSIPLISQRFSRQ